MISPTSSIKAQRIRSKTSAARLTKKRTRRLRSSPSTRLDGSDIESYAVNLFHQWSIGAKSTDRGVLILYAIRDRRDRIEVGYGLEPILPDGKVGGFREKPFR